MSYLAISQWVAGSDTPPSSLKAIIPWQGQSDNFREILYRGGIPETGFTGFWMNRISGLAHDSPLPPLPVVRRVHRHPMLMKHVQDRLTPPSGIDLPSISMPALIAGTWSDQGLHMRGSCEGIQADRVGAEMAVRPWPPKMEHLR
ncbi:MAG: hypothetical protein HRU31_00515 [Rhodobacteraceae bacterium]|nr:hypothetical protein [Paracoccaceae bacterium]